MAHGECELACGRLVMAALSTGTQRDSNFGRQSRCKSGLDDPVRGKRGCIHAEVAGNDSQDFASAPRPSSTPRSAGPGPGARLGSITVMRRGRGSVAPWCIWQCGWVPAIFSVSRRTYTHAFTSRPQQPQILRERCIGVFLVALYVLWTNADYSCGQGSLCIRYPGAGALNVICDPLTPVQGA